MVAPSKFLIARMDLIEVEFFVILGVGIVIIGGEGRWDSISDSTYIWGFFYPSIRFVIFSPFASIFGGSL